MGTKPRRVYFLFKVINQEKKKKVIEQLLLDFPQRFPTISVSKNAIKKIGHSACLRYIMGQTYPGYAWTGTDHARYFIR